MRQHLGQGAIYRIVDGSHEIIVRGVAYVGKALDEAIEKARSTQR